MYCIADHCLEPGLVGIETRYYHGNYTAGNELIKI